MAPAMNPLSVLIVDDQEAQRDLCAAALKSEEIELVTASDADLALEILRSRSFDVVLSDVEMPGSNFQKASPLSAETLRSFGSSASILSPTPFFSTASAAS